MNVNSDLVTLALETRRESDALLLDVTIQNRGGDDVFLRAYPADFDNVVLREGEAFIAIETEPPLVRVSLLPPEPPGGINFSVAVQSLVVRLGPGDRFETIIAVPTPVRPWNPYLDALGKRAVAFFPALDEVSTLVFETAWHLVADSTKQMAGPSSDTWWSIGAPEHLLRYEGPLDPPLPVEPRSLPPSLFP